MTNPNPGPAGSVTEARTVAPATSVGPATSTAPATSTGAAPTTTGTTGTTATDLPYVAPSQTFSPERVRLPADHPQVLAASAPPPSPDAYRRAPSDPKERAMQAEERRARLDAERKTR